MSKYKHSDEAKRKISEALKGHTISKAHIEKLINSRTQEAYDKISKKLKGRKISQATREKISKANSGKKRTLECKNKMSENVKGRKYSEESKRKMSDSHKGHEVSDETKHKIAKANKRENYTSKQLKIRASKIYLKRKLNQTLNTSKPEEELYQKLLKENISKTIYRQYKDKKRYPYYCDFYIVEDDLFIELNNHWTHGGKPFNPTDIDCINQLKEWEDKAKTSKFFQQAIETWTIRDVEKQKCARQNNLNYKIIY